MDEPGRRVAASAASRRGLQPAAYDFEQSREVGGRSSLPDGSGPNGSVFTPWVQSARLADLGTIPGGVQLSNANLLRQAAEHAFVDLVVSSFKSFQEVGGFQRALASIPEAGSIRVRHLHHGTLQVSVQCRSAGSLLRSLASAYERSFTVRAREPHRIELALHDDAYSGSPV